MRVVVRSANLGWIAERSTTIGQLLIEQSLAMH